MDLKAIKICDMAKYTFSTDSGEVSVDARTRAEAEALAAEQKPGEKLTLVSRVASAPGALPKKHREKKEAKAPKKEFVDGMTKWELNEILDKDSKQIPWDNGYFGGYTPVKLNGKYNIVYCDDSNAECYTALADWVDKIVSVDWSGDYRWNHDRPAVIKEGDKFNVVKAPGGGLYKSSKKQKPLIDGGFDKLFATWHNENGVGTVLTVEKDGKKEFIDLTGNIVESDLDAKFEEVKKYDKEQTKQWIENGGPCTKTKGWAYRGAPHKEISKQEALKLLPSYSFDKGFKNLSWINHNGKVTLDFNELSELDME